jgi:hypothetical protein
MKKSTHKLIGSAWAVLAVACTFHILMNLLQGKPWSIQGIHLGLAPPLPLHNSNFILACLCSPALDFGRSVNKMLIEEQWKYIERF